MVNTSFLWTLGGFIVLLTPVVLIHEFGHFIAAKLSREISGELNHSSYEKWVTGQKEQTSSNQQYYWGLAFAEAIATGMTKAFTSLAP